MTNTTTILLHLLFLTTTSTAFQHVFVGTGAIEVQLIAAKLAIREGDTCSIVGPSDTSHVRSCNALLYGSKAAKAMDSTENIAKATPLAFVTDGEDIAASLGQADYLHLVCDDNALEDGMVGSILESAPVLKHVVLLSKIGGKFSGLERALKDLCGKRDVPCSVLRCGVWKGGGPGGKPEDTDTAVAAGESSTTASAVAEYGLSRFFYDTNYDLPNAMNTMAFDKFTLGAKVTPGDPFKIPMKLWQAFTASSSFGPSDTDTGRIAAAQAMLACINRERGVDVSLSTESGVMPPGKEEWEEMLSKGEY